MAKKFISYCEHCKKEIPYNKVKVIGETFIDGKCVCPYCNNKLKLYTEEF